MMERDEGARITVRVTPRAGRNELIRDGAMLRARLTEKGFSSPQAAGF
jgi:uncharacterized protein YggU (UPF0235/DUF167 family)